MPSGTSTCGAPVELPTLLVAVACALTLGACGDLGAGSLTLAVDTTAADLDPLADPRVARLTLYDDVTGVTLGDAAYGDGGRLRLAALAPGTRDLRLEALSATNQVLAVARDFDVPVETGQSRTVTMYLRKPLAYVGGGANVQVRNTAAAPSDPSAMTAVALANVKALATTRRGDLLLAAVEEPGGSSFVWIDTATHEERGRVPLGAPVRGIVVHPRDRYLALLQNLGGAVLVVPTDALRQGRDLETAFSSIPVSMPLAATFADDDTLWVLSATPANCDRPLSNPGQLVHLDLGGGQVDTAVPLPGMASDVGLDPVTGAPLVALVCSGKIVELQGGSFVDVVATGGVASVAVDGQSVYAVGWQPPTSPDLLPGVVAVRDLRDGGEPRSVVFPIESVPLTLGETDDHGNYKYLYIAATALKARAVSVTAHGGRVAFLHSISYQLVTDLRDPQTGFPICNELVISLTEEGVTLVDLETAQIVWSRPTSYENRCTCDRVDQGVCIQDLDANLEGAPFTPTALSVLTGER